MIKIKKITMYPQEELIRRLREITLTDGVTKPYEKSEIEITKWVGFSLIRFAQTYVLKSDSQKVGHLYNALKEFGIDMVDISTLLEITIEDESGNETTFSYIPPVVEWTPEDGYYISDGMHRFDFFLRFCFSARMMIVVKNPSAPYYALPCDLTWDTLPMVDERPEVRKIYRDPDNYKALFRDYNSQFPGIQRDRSNDKKDVK